MMKLSNNSIGILIFFVLSTAVFVLMALRPAVEGNAMNFGMPESSEMTASNTESPVEAPTITDVEKTEENGMAAPETVEPSIDKELSANNEPSVSKESAADKEPSVDEELLLDKEPSATN